MFLVFGVEQHVPEFRAISDETLWRDKFDVSAREAKTYDDDFYAISRMMINSISRRMSRTM